MSIKERFNIRGVNKGEIKEWFLQKHYAKRMPSVSYCYGLYEGTTLVGIVSFGMPAMYVEMEAWRPFELLELNRLVVSEGLPKNALSYFVSGAIKYLPTPRVLLSYSDLKQGHHGYIYQATNWHYTGIGGLGHHVFIMKDGTQKHERHSKTLDPDLIERVEPITVGKARYYYFHGNKREKRAMQEMLRFEVQPYPKGDNERYDASYEPNVQLLAF